MSTGFDVVAIGHAIVDVLVHADDDLVATVGIEKGTMNLIDADTAEQLYAKLGPAVEASGGSAANTAAGLASLGSNVAFVGKIRDDQLGEVFAHDIRAIGVSFAGQPAGSGQPTGRCLILVTADGERTMGTHLGIADEVDVDEVDRALAPGAAVTYIEGYMIGLPGSAAAVERAIADTRAGGGQVALTLSDPFWVELHGNRFRELLAAGVIDVLFANEDEAIGLTGAPSFEAAVAALHEQCPLVTVTRGAAGAVVASRYTGLESVPAAPVDKVVDTTGAGDLYAAGFLHGLTHGLSPVECARLGALCAAEVISHMGARPEVSLTSLLLH
jgi:sugar/nucleoside kinase (ribokinase family)